MNLSDEQADELDKTNELMAKSDRTKCPSCGAQQGKGYCNKCDNHIYSCTHKPRCTMKDWGNIDCSCKDDKEISYVDWLHQQGRKW